ncbi:MAG: hypothetical protein LC131_07555 [Anaerolineae bacterium]|nr:hypothetical protein [Anaerolineae bacterium]
MRPILKAAERIHELQNNLEIISTDDRKEITDYTDAEIVAEADYVLSCFGESGHALNDCLGSEDRSVRASAQRQVKALRAFILKYKA